MSRVLLVEVPDGVSLGAVLDAVRSAAGPGATVHAVASTLSRQILDAARPPAGPHRGDDIVR